MTLCKLRVQLEIMQNYYIKINRLVDNNSEEFFDTLIQLEERRKRINAIYNLFSLYYFK